MDIKDTFIRDVLQREGKAIDDAMEAAINNRLRFHFGRLNKARKYKVNNGELNFNINIAQRFLDLNAKLRDGTKRKKKYPIYNKIIFGHYNEIAYKLMYGFTQDVADDIAKQFKNNQ